MFFQDNFIENRISNNLGKSLTIPAKLKKILTC